MTEMLTERNTDPEPEPEPGPCPIEMAYDQAVKYVEAEFPHMCEDEAQAFVLDIAQRILNGLRFNTDL